MKYSTDYHDYVFKNGKFIGKFDQMYKNSVDIPWHQDKTVSSLAADIDIAILRQFQYESICEIGCGLGYFAQRLFSELRNNQNKHPQVTSIDISQTAIRKAKRLFPRILFVKGDLLKDKSLGIGLFDLIVAKEILWYVCHKMPKFLKNIFSLIKENGLIYISQSFPEVKNWVGKDIINSPDCIKKIFTEYATPIYYCIERDLKHKNRPLVHFLGMKKIR